MGREALSTRIKAIDKKLARLTPINAQEHCIFKVHKQLFKVNEKAYKPVLLAIGPYNDHGKVGQGLMEEHKLRYLKQMLERRNESSVKDYISALSDLEERARNCYAERIRLTTYEFVEMMLLDGCFIIELFRKREMRNLRDKHDPIFQTRWMRNVIARDLLLFENQLPFFVLTQLFEMSASDQTPLPSTSIHFGEHIVHIDQNNEITCLESSTPIDQRFQIKGHELVDLTIYFFSGSLPFQDWDIKGSSSYLAKKPFPLRQMHKAITPPLAKIVDEHRKVGDIFKKADFKHLLDLIHTMIKLSVLDMELDQAIEHQEVGVKFNMGEIFKHFLGLIRRVASPLLPKLENIKKCGKKKPSRHATELKEAGVKFKKAKQRTTFAIQFSNGVLEISPLRIEDDTETFLRNLIAYEQNDPHKGSSYVTDYMCFMDDLIESPKDVELLRQRGIIENWLGEDKVVSTMFNKLGHHVTVSPRKSISAKTSIDMNTHCDKRWNVWMAKLRHNYFNSPWALLSVLAAIILLGLAITQTVFSIIH